MVGAREKRALYAVTVHQWKMHHAIARYITVPRQTLEYGCGTLPPLVGI